jgi:RNA polymerase sigma factor (sigma-70 family)
MTNEKLERLRQEYELTLYGIAHREIGEHLNGKISASEAVQETWLKAKKSQIELSNPRAWLRSVLIRQIQSAGRKLKRKRKTIPIEDRELLDSKTNTPSHCAKTIEAREMLRTAIALLSPEDRVVIILMYTERMSHDEIGQALGVSQDAAKMRLSRAREKLRKNLVGKSSVLQILIEREPHDR